MTFPLPGANWTYTHSLRLVAATGAAGFNLQNATSTILTWTAPNDGNMHRISVVGVLHVTSAETGGAVTIPYLAPDGSGSTTTLFAGGAGLGTTGASADRIVQAGSTVTLSQASALTVGAAVLWAEIWAL